MLNREKVKNFFLDSYKKILIIKDIVHTLHENFIHHIPINHKSLNQDTVSIVMTTCNRSIQTYFTLETIASSEVKNVQVIIVDDSTHDPLNEELLKKYNLHIDYIKIKNKNWINPCINYNIGFKFIRGGKVIIQNGEVCHVGDVISYIDEHLKENDYLIFDVMALKNMNANHELHKRGSLKTDDLHFYVRNMHMWYQHASIRNVKFHFLVSMTKKTFDHIGGGFDYDYCLGCSYDDNDLLIKAEVANVNFINVRHNISKVMGIHQWHTSTLIAPTIIYNEVLFIAKRNYYHKNKKYISLLSDKDDELIKARIHELFSY
jgi:glycosyltransferase involved in cell wall biosynthesis